MAASPHSARAIRAVASATAKPTRSTLQARALALTRRRDRELAPNIGGLHAVVQSHRIDIDELATIMAEVAAFVETGKLPESRKGARGLQGQQGEQGEQGPIGPEGPEGPQGPPGDCPCDGHGTEIGGFEGVPIDNVWPPPPEQTGEFLHDALDLPATEPHPMTDPKWWGERIGMTLPRWGGASLPSRTWPARAHYRKTDETVPRVYLGDYLAGTPSLWRVATGRFAREPLAALTGPPGPALEHGVHFVYQDRAFVVESDGVARSAYLLALQYGLRGAAATGAYLNYAGVGGVHRGFHAGRSVVFRQITAVRTAGSSGGGFDLYWSNGIAETFIKAFTFTGAALTFIDNAPACGLVVGGTLAVKTTGLTHTDLHVTIVASEIQ